MVCILGRLINVFAGGCTVIDFPYRKYTTSSHHLVVSPVSMRGEVDLISEVGIKNFKMSATTEYDQTQNVQILEIFRTSRVNICIIFSSYHGIKNM